MSGTPLKSFLDNAITLIFIGILLFSDDPAYHPENGSDGSELEDDASGKDQRRKMRLPSFPKLHSTSRSQPSGLC